jgi:serine/threonine protein kinase
MDKLADQQPLIRKLCPVCGHITVDHAAEKCSADGSTLVVFPQDALIGKTVYERYHLRALLGEGGWSTVYKADDITLGRVVAVKIMQAHLLAHADRVMRFKREATAISTFNHANIRAIYDCGVLASGQPFMIMEYLEGETLSDLLKAKQSLSVRRVVDISIQVCDALQSAHEKGIIHRDVKPSNIMLLSQSDRMDFVKVMDFGLAKFTDSTVATDLTATGETVGTAAYMSPEQCLGKDPDGRSDIYSLGCVMYEAITGQKAIDGQANQCLLNHISQSPRPFSEVRSDLYIPQFLESIVFKALEKDPANRFQSFKEMADALSTNQKVQGANLNQSTRARPLAASLQKNALLLVASVVTVASLVYSISAVITTNNHPSAPRLEKVKADTAVRATTGGTKLSSIGKTQPQPAVVPAVHPIASSIVRQAPVQPDTVKETKPTSPQKITQAANLQTAKDDSSKAKHGSSATVPLKQPVHIAPNIVQVSTKKPTADASLAQIAQITKSINDLTASGRGESSQAAGLWETLGSMYQKMGNEKYSEECYEQAGKIKSTMSQSARAVNAPAQQSASTPAPSTSKVAKQPGGLLAIFRKALVTPEYRPSAIQALSDGLNEQSSKGKGETAGAANKWAMIGQLYYKQGDVKASEHCYEQAVRIDSKVGDHRNEKAFSIAVARLIRAKTDLGKKQEADQLRKLYPNFDTQP